MPRNEPRPLPPNWRDSRVRFEAKVDQRGPDECWPWIPPLAGWYGQMGMGSKKDGTRRPYASNRLAWAFAHDADPWPFLVLHHCDFPPCCNPIDLFLGTHEDNIADMSVKGRHANSLKTHCPQRHEYTVANTYLDHGRRRCKTCMADRQRAYFKGKRT